MTPQNKLYEAAMALIGDLINRRSHFNSFQNLCRVLCEYEQSIEQPEAIAGEKTAYELALNYLSEMGYGSGTNFTSKGVASLLADFASQQTSAKDKEIAELKEAISELIQVKDWKDKYGKDEHYLKACPIAWENVRKLIQK